MQQRICQFMLVQCVIFFARHASGLVVRRIEPAIDLFRCFFAESSRKASEDLRTSNWGTSPRWQV